MCGIAGIFDPSASSDEPTLTRLADTMASSLAHRGPDDHGVWADAAAGIALGHRRLSIIDLSVEGHQPMLSRDGRFALAFNGEIYNHPALRRELAAKGVSFRGHSDTEVLLEGIATWGVCASLDRAEGMFALALWDREERRLSLARDRLGEKPLYYGRAGGDLVFASELKALRAHPDWTGAIDRDAVALYLRYRYVPAPHTIYSGIRKLAPGTIAHFGATAGVGEPHLERYWSMREVSEEGAARPLRLSDREAVDELERVLTDSIERQMLADVPVGAFLSGGIDSSTIVSLMREHSPGRVRTFTIGFHEDGFDEAAHARAVAKHLGTDHTELYVTAGDALAVVPELPRIYDEPFADDSQIPTFLLARMTRQQVTVALTGDGGDELFAGYTRHFAGRRLGRAIRRVPAPIRRGIAAAIEATPTAFWDRGGRLLSRSRSGANGFARMGDRVQKLASALAVSTPEEMYRRLVSVWPDPPPVSRNSFEPLATASDRAGHASLSDFTLRMLYLDAVSYLPDDILVKVDRAAMRVSLETRVPFLSRSVVEFAARIPLEQKIRDGRGKWIVRQLLYRRVPPALVERPKAGFTLPIAGWLRGPLREWAEDLLSRRRLAEEGFLDPDPIRRRWRQHLDGQRNAHIELWAVLMFQAWLDAERSGQPAVRALSV